MVANKYAFLQSTRRRFLNEWEAFKKVVSRRNIRRRITIPLTLSNLKLLRRITRTENILHRNFTRRQVAIQNRVASKIGISQSTFSVKVLNLFSRSRRKTNKGKSKHSAMLRNKETRHRMFIGFFFQAEDGIRDYKVTGVQTCALPILGYAEVCECENRANGRQRPEHDAQRVSRRGTANIERLAIRSDHSSRRRIGDFEARQIGRASCRERV